jgi:hypothetical protein
MRDVEMDQLPVEPRDIVVPLLKGRLRPLERGALLLEPTLLKMATGTRNPLTRRVLPDKKAGVELILYPWVC